MLLATAAQAAVSVSSQPTQNMSCSGGVCTATAWDASLNVNDVTNMLAAGDLKIATGNAGAQDIHVEAPFSWTSTSGLTLDAQRSIEFKQPVTVAGTGALTLVTNDGGRHGDYWFDPGASVSFWDTNSVLVINDRSFTLVKDIKTLASAIAAKPYGRFALANSYDASIDGTYTSAPIQTGFGGTFEGLSNPIKNLTIIVNTPHAGVGLFAASAGVLRDQILTDVSISGGKRDQVGALAGWNRSTGTIARVAVSGTLSAGNRSYIGGIAGENAGVLSRASSSARVGGRSYCAGGLVGLNEGSILLSTDSGKVHDGDCAGGLVGYQVYGTTTQSYASGEVSGASAGGLVGIARGLAVINQSYATAKVESADNAGGLVGYEDGGAIDQSYAAGPVSNAAESGGVIGNFHAGYYGFDASYAYWNKSTVGQAAGTGAGDLPGITGLTNKQLQAKLPDGFDPRVWGRDPAINHGWPYLLADPPPQ